MAVSRFALRVVEHATAIGSDMAGLVALDFVLGIIFRHAVCSLVAKSLLWTPMIVPNSRPISELQVAWSPILNGITNSLVPA
jgi:hypothetical protein